MITLNLKFNDDYKKVAVKDELIFNAILSEHPNMIKSLMYKKIIINTLIIIIMDKNIIL